MNASRPESYDPLRIDVHERHSLNGQRSRGVAQSMQVLPDRLTLHDVRDVEASIAQVLHESLRRGAVPTSGQDYLDLMEYLLDVVARESLKFDPSYGLKFRTILNWRVRQRTVDWLRQNKHQGRNNAPRHEIVELSAVDEDLHAEFEDGVISRLAVA